MINLIARKCLDPLDNMKPLHFLPSLSLAIRAVKQPWQWSDTIQLLECWIIVQCVHIWSYDLIFTWCTLHKCLSGHSLLPNWKQWKLNLGGKHLELYIPDISKKKGGYNYRKVPQHWNIWLFLLKWGKWSETLSLRTSSKHPTLGILLTWRSPWVTTKGYKYWHKYRHKYR